MLIPLAEPYIDSMTASWPCAMRCGGRASSPSPHDRCDGTSTPNGNTASFAALTSGHSGGGGGKLTMSASVALLAFPLALGLALPIRLCLRLGLALPLGLGRWFRLRLRLRHGLEILD